ncbi:MAG: alpha/beta fold hydrolase [Geothrix sp.]|nr:alpha/beta fold hydrolase [Geothrix sp.]
MLRPLHPWITGLSRLLIWALLAYAGLCLAAFLAQRRMLYFPDRGGEPEALQRAARLGLAPWRDGAGRLLGWRRPLMTGSRPRVLVLHGNAGDALGRVVYLPVLEAAGFEGVLLEYPGYGCRPGAPTEATLVADARAALSLLRQERTPVVLMGESLGSGVAVQAAAADPDSVAGLLLTVPFARMTEVAAHHYPYLPMGLLLRDRWDSLGAARGYPGPVAVLVAGRDEVVGPGQGHRLAGAFPGPVRVWEAPQSGHNELQLDPGRPPWSDMLAFLREQAGMRQ